MHSVLSPDLDIGEMNEVFKSWGKTPVNMDWLKI